MFFNVIVILVLLFIVSKQNSRLTRIEKDLGNLSKGTFTPNLKNTPIEQPVTNSVNINVSSPEDTAISQQQTPEKIPVQNQVAKADSEEASGRLLGKIGIGAVIIGIAFFLNYAFENNWIGPAGRVMLGIIIGIILLGVGQFLRKKYLQYSDLLMGGGIAVLYLSVYSAHSFYHLIDSFMTGLFMLCVTVLAFVISIVNATPILAMVSVVGGFATPFLVGSGANDMFALFSYLTLLNIGILAISSFKKWPELIVAAFIGTAINFGSWFDTYYRPDALGPVLFFCFLTFIIFLITSVVRATAEKTETDQANFFLLGVNAFAIAMMSYILLKPEYEGILGFIAVAIAIVYMFVAVTVNKFNPGDTALNIFLPGLAVTFLSIAVPLQLSGQWIAIAWFVESVALYLVASSIGNRGFQVMGAVVYVLGLINFFGWNFPKINDATFVPIMNSHFVILVLGIISAYIIAYMYRKFGSVTVEIQKQGIAAFVIIASVLTVFAFSTQIIFYHNAKLIQSQTRYQVQNTDNSLYNNGYDTSKQRQEVSQKYYAEQSSIKNRSNTYVSILWAIYAAILTAIGFGKRMLAPRRLGLVLFIITAVKVMFDVWSLGSLYRIVSFIVFGVIALSTSFAYSKYKDRLKEII